MMSLHSVLTYIALRAEVSGHKEVSGRSWKDVADEVLVYNKIIDCEYELAAFIGTPIATDIEDNVIDLTRDNIELESIINITYAGFTSDPSRYQDGYDEFSGIWKPLADGPEVSHVEHALILHEPQCKETLIYYNYDIETCVSVIDSCFKTIYIAE